MHKYYSILRPIGPGTAPGGAVEIVNYDDITYIDDIGREAWGYLIYREPLENPEDYDLMESDQ